MKLCALCGIVLKTKTPKEIKFKNYIVSVCSSCLPVVRYPGEYDFKEFPKKTFKCRECGFRKPITLEYWPFILDNCSFGQPCWVCMGESAWRSIKTLLPEEGKFLNIKPLPRKKILSKKKLPIKEKIISKREPSILSQCLKQYKDILSEKEIGVLCQRHQAIKARTRRRFPGGEIISLDDFIQLFLNHKGKCFYTGLSYSLNGEGMKNPLTVTVDRIDSSIGYTKDNIVFCCFFVNNAKGPWELNQMKELWKCLPTS